MGIVSYRFEPEMIDELLELRARLYGDSPDTALQGEEIRRQLSPRFFFNEIAGNDYCGFVIKRHGELVGHTIAIVNSQMKGPDELPVGLIGFFECLDDYEVASELLDAATDWLKNSKGVARIWGPIQFDIWHGYRFKTRGHKVSAFTGEPVNKPYYPHFFERYGFHEKWIWNSVWIAEADAFDNLVSHRTPTPGYLINRDLRFTTLLSDEDLTDLYEAIMASFKKLPGFTLLPFVEFEQLYRQRCHDTRLTTIIRDRQDRVAAFTVAYPNHLAYNVPGTSGKEAVFFLVGIPGSGGLQNPMLAPSIVYHAVRECFHSGYGSVVLAMMRKSIWLKAISLKHLDDASSSYALYEFER